MRLTSCTIVHFHFRISNCYERIVLSFLEDDQYYIFIDVCETQTFFKANKKKQQQKKQAKKAVYGMQRLPRFLI